MLCALYSDQMAQITRDADGYIRCWWSWLWCWYVNFLVWFSAHAQAPEIRCCYWKWNYWCNLLIYMSFGCLLPFAT